MRLVLLSRLFRAIDLRFSPFYASMSFHNLISIVVHRFPPFTTVLFSVLLFLVLVYTTCSHIDRHVIRTTVLCMSRVLPAFFSLVSHDLHLVIIKPSRLEEFVRLSYIVCDQ